MHEVRPREDRCVSGLGVRVESLGFRVSGGRSLGVTTATCQPSRCLGSQGGLLVDVAALRKPFALVRFEFGFCCTGFRV